MDNRQLKEIIQKIEVDKDGGVDIYLRLFKEPESDGTVPVGDSHTRRHHGQKNGLHL